jgi:predicted TIM-barrel fold metal-dependent hydrolase
MRKLGPERWVYGSDAPFVPIPESLACTREFFEDHRFGAAAVEQIFHGTAAALLQDR